MSESELIDGAGDMALLLYTRHGSTSVVLNYIADVRYDYVCDNLGVAVVSR